MTSPGQPSSYDARGVSDALRQAHRARPRPNSPAGAPAQRPLWSDSDIVVPISDMGPSFAFAEVVARRHSVRRFAPAALSDIGLMMARSGLLRHGARDDSGRSIASRPAPSAGARQPLTLVLLAHSVDGLSPGPWVLDAEYAVLRPGAYPERAVEDALAAVGNALRLPEPPPAAVYVVGHPHTTLERYPDGISLLWREVGALLMLLHLAATDLGLASCMAGTCAVLHPVPEPGELDGPIDLGALVVGAAGTRTGVGASQR